MIDDHEADDDIEDDEEILRGDRTSALAFMIAGALIVAGCIIATLVAIDPMLGNDDPTPDSRWIILALIGLIAVGGLLLAALGSVVDRLTRLIELGLYQYTHSDDD